MIRSILILLKISLALAILTLTTASITLNSPPQGESQPANHNQKSQNTKPDSPDSPVIAFAPSKDYIPPQSPTTEERNESIYTNEAKPYRWAEILESIMVIATLVLAVVGVITARAAWINAQAIINSERAWIHGDFVGRRIKVGTTRCSLIITNQGKTPAQLLGYEVWHGLLNEGTPFSKERLSGHFTESKLIFVGGGQSETLRDNFILEDLFVMASGETPASSGILRGALYITIKYQDVIFERERRKEHHTSFVYICDLPAGESIQRIAEYNDYT